MGNSLRIDQCKLFFVGKKRVGSFMYRVVVSSIVSVARYRVLSNSNILAEREFRLNWTRWVFIIYR